MRKLLIIAFITVCVMIGMNQKVFAKGESMDFKQLVKDAFHTQVALSEKERSLKEVKQILNKHFTKDFISLFLKENLVKTEHGYQTFGSDFPLYYIPFFSYDEKTIVKKAGKKIYVFENMAKKEAGPVDYKSDYQGVRLTKVDGVWKIDKILYTVPQDIIHSTPITIKRKQKSLLKNGELHLSSIILSPFTSFIIPTNLQPFWIFISKI